MSSRATSIVYPFVIDILWVYLKNHKSSDIRSNVYTGSTGVGRVNRFGMPFSWTHSLSNLSKLAPEKLVIYKVNSLSIHCHYNFTIYSGGLGLKIWVARRQIGQSTSIVYHLREHINTIYLILRKIFNTNYVMFKRTFAIGQIEILATTALFLNVYGREPVVCTDLLMFGATSYYKT